MRGHRSLLLFLRVSSLIGYRFDSRAYRSKRIPLRSGCGLFKFHAIEIGRHARCTRACVFRDLAIRLCEGDMGGYSRFESEIAVEWRGTNGWMVFLKIIWIESSSRDFYVECGYRWSGNVKGQLLLIDFFFFFFHQRSRNRLVRMIGWLDFYLVIEYKFAIYEILFSFLANTINFPRFSWEMYVINYYSSSLFVNTKIEWHNWNVKSNNKTSMVGQVRV